MKRSVTAVMGTAAMVLWTVAASAQAKPNFAGKWVMDQEKTQAVNPAPQGGGNGGGRMGGRGGFGGGDMTIAVDAGSMSVTRAGRNGDMTTTYKLDGSEQTIQQGQGEAKVTAKWDGDKIVVKTTRDFQGNSITTTATYSMDGDALVVSNERPGRGGDGAMTTSKTYYKRG